MAVAVIDVIKQRLAVDCARTLVEAAGPTGKWTEADVDGWKADFLERLEAKVGELPAAPPGCPLTDAHGEVTSLLKERDQSGEGWPGWLSAMPLVTKLTGYQEWVDALLADLVIAEEDAREND